MDVRIAIPDRHVSEGVLNAGLEAVTRVNEALIKEGSSPTFTQAIKDGVRWAPEPPGHESFDHGLKVAQRGWGDCDDLAPLRAASLRATGQDPAAIAVVYKSGPGRWHAVVQRSDGRLEDPSRTAGMKVRPGSKAEGIPAAVVGMMGPPSVDGAVRPFVAVRRDDAGYLARVDVPITEGACLSCVQHGRSPSHALAGCMAGACMVGDASGMVDTDALDKMWALHGLMKGSSLKDVAQVVGVDAAKDALLTLKQIAPDLVEELRKHWHDARALREDFERQKTAPGVGSLHHRRHHGHHRHHHVHGDPPQYSPGAGALHMATEELPEVPSLWSHLDRVSSVSPYQQRFAQRGRQYVGAATMSPYLEMRADSSWGTAPRRAYGHNEVFAEPFAVSQVGQAGALHMATEETPAQWGDHLLHERVQSPYGQRFGHRGRQFVGTVGAGLPFHPTLSFSLAGAHRGHHGHHPHHHYRRGAAHIVGEADLADAVNRALRAPEIVGWDLFKDVVQPAANAVSHIDLKGVGQFAGDILKGAQGVISMIPGIGTGISAAISAGLAILSGGGPLEIAVKTAYGAIPIPPGIRNATDIVVDAALSLAHTQNLADTGIAMARKAVIDRLPGFAQGIGGSVFDTLAHIVLGSVHKTPTHAVVTPAPANGFPPAVKAISDATHYAMLAKVAAAQAAARKPPPPRPVIKLAVRPKPAVMPVRAMALPPAPAAPLAPLSLSLIARTMSPEIIRHHIAVPKGVRA